MDFVQKNINSKNSDINKHEKGQDRKNIAKIVEILSGENKWRKKRDQLANTRNKERGQFIVTTLSKYFDLSKIKIIEMGCGVGWHTVELARYCPNVVGIDTNENTLNFAKSYSKIENVSITYKNGDACATDYPDDYFDIVILSHLLEHAQSHEEPIREANWILKNNGILFMASPNSFWPIEQHLKLPFLHWLPRDIADRYVRMFKRADDFSGITKTPNYFEILYLLKNMALSSKILAILN